MRFELRSSDGFDLLRTTRESIAIGCQEIQAERKNKFNFNFVLIIFILKPYSKKINLTFKFVDIWCEMATLIMYGRGSQPFSACVPPNQNLLAPRTH
jgi:hypothetical protein